jgi:hypothetical protein
LSTLGENENPTKEALQANEGQLQVDHQIIGEGKCRKTNPPSTFQKKNPKEATDLEMGMEDETQEKYEEDNIL